MSERIWKFTGETKCAFGVTLRRIRRIGDGKIGGWIEKEANLEMEAFVYGEAAVYGNAKVSGNARVAGHADVAGDAKVESSEDYCVFKNTWSSLRWFTYTRSNKKWIVGCFCGTGKELIAKAYADSNISGKCYEAIVKAQEAIEKAKNEGAKNGR